MSQNQVDLILIPCTSQGFVQIRFELALKETDVVLIYTGSSLFGVSKLFACVNNLTFPGSDVILTLTVGGRKPFLCFEFI